MTRYDFRASTTSLPAHFPSDEIGLMTRDEFLHYRNPKDKQHPSDAYDFDLLKMNYERSHHLGSLQQIQASQYPNGVKLEVEGKPIAVLHGGVAYYDNPRWARRLPNVVFNGQKKIPLEFTRTQQVKYLSELMPTISPTAKINREEYPVVLQHIIVQGEPMTVRAAKQPVPNKGTSLAILNQDGLKVAIGQDEWGATLLSVAQEYRGKGLGKIIGHYWYEHNPGYNSGGFTSSGERNAIELWKDRVREFLDHGWYSELVREKRLTLDRVNAIVKDVGKRVKRDEPTKEESVKPTGDLLVYADGISFVLYDRAFLSEQSDRFIYGFGFFRDADPVGTFVFRLEYERKYAELATKIILQMARDNNEKLYDGGGYSDMLEGAEAIPGVVKDGDYLEVTRDLVPLKQLKRLEELTRRKVDPYREIYNSLVEQAEAKWN